MVLSTQCTVFVDCQFTNYSGCRSAQSRRLLNGIVLCVLDVPWWSRMGGAAAFADPSRLTSAR
jgi:hypothetical protein